MLKSSIQTAAESAWRRALMVVLLLALAGPLAASQLTLRGTITDSLGRALAGVELTLRDRGGSAVARTVSDAQGHFQISAARPESYGLIASKAGFRTATKSVSFPPAGGEPLSIAMESKSALTVPVSASRARPQNSVSSTGANEYTVTAADIANLPQGDNSTITGVLTQMPGVAIDQNQQIHIRNTEGPQFQYQINGVLIPLDINTNPPFISMLNPMFVERLSLIDGIVPSRYSYATGGVVDIRTRNGCEAPGGSATMYGGKRNTIQPSFQYGGCIGDFSYYVSGLYQQSNTAFSSATPGPDAIHDHTNQGQGFGFFTYDLTPATRLSLITSISASDNQLPNQPNLPPAFALQGVTSYPSADINSYLNFRDYMGILALDGSLTPETSYQLAYAAHYISQKYEPDDIGELIYQGVAFDGFSQRCRQHAGGQSHAPAWPAYAGLRILSGRIRGRGG